MTPRKLACFVLALSLISGLTWASPIVIVSKSAQNQVQLEKSSTPEAAARAFLKASAGEMGLRADLSDLKTESITNTPAGYVVRFQQVIQGLVVDRSDLVVSLSQDKIPLTYVNDTMRVSQTAALNEIAPAFHITEQEALARVYEELKLTASPTKQEITRKVMFEKGKLRSVYLIQLSAPLDRRYAWEVVVDAETGVIYRSRDLIVNQRRARAMVAVNVFDPNPTIKSGFKLNGTAGYSDSNNADSGFFQSMMTDVSLDNVTLRSDGKVELSGPNVVIADSEAPKNPDCTFRGSSYKLRRNDPCFDAVNVYYFIDKEMKYLNGTLGFRLHPIKYSGGVRVDPHGLNGEDNSHYSPFSDELAFGEGGVDDAQDHDVIIHEMGHAIHSWITRGHLSQVEGLSEGSGDYWAASYDRQFMRPNHLAYNWTFSYDGHNEFWPGRVTNVTSKYPAGAKGEIHTAGQLWATVCMEIYDVIGKEKADRLFWTALSGLSESSSQLDAAKAYVVATQQLYPADLNTVIQKFKNRGYSVQ